ncbi:MAG: TolC family outer membrane protein [Steroidobacteraceae bacterium]
MHRAPCLAFIGVILLVPAATPASANDLMRLYRLALMHDTTLLAAKYQRNAAIEARPQALAQWLPQVSGTGSKERHFLSEQAASFGLTDNGSSPPPLGYFGLADCARTSVNTVHCTANTTSYGLTLTQTVWSYQAYSQLKEADAQAASAEASYVSAQQDFVLRVAEAYLRVLGAQDQLTALRLERDAYAMQLKQAQDRERTGLGSRSDVEQVQSYYDLTAQILINAQNALDDADLTLATLVGEPPGHLAPLIDQIPLTAPDPASAAAWVTSALRDNPGVRAAELTVGAAERDISVQRGRGLPTIALGGSDRRAVGPPVLGGNTTIGTVGVYLNWPLFQGGAVASAVRQSRALYHQSEANLETSRRDTAQQTRAAYRNIVAGIASINAARRAEDSASTAVQAARHDIEFNVSPEFILLSYQARYYSAVNAYDQARYAYLTNVLVLKQQAGQLTERDLAAIDALLVARGSGK